MNDIFDLIEQMPAGLPDPEAYQKLGTERQEFFEAKTPDEKLEEAVDRGLLRVKRDI